jgi:putative membrane protein
MIKKIVLNFILNGGALYGVTYIFPVQIHYTGGFGFFALGGVVMGILNAVVKPVLKLLALPLQIVTLGLSLIILNGIIFWIFKIIIDIIAIGGITIQIDAIKTYFLAGVVFGIINWLENIFIPHS